MATLEGHDEVLQLRFQSAARHAAKLAWLLGVGFCLTLASVIVLWLDLLPSWRSVLTAQCAALLMVMGAAHALYWLSRWRADALVSSQEPSFTGDTAAPQDSDKARSWLARGWFCWQRSWHCLTALLHRYIPVLGLIFYSGLALFLVAQETPVEAGATLEVPAIALSGTLLCLAFALLVLERYYAGARCRDLPEAQHLAYPLRVALGVTLVLASCVLLQPPPDSWWVLIPGWVAVLPAAVVLEYGLRTLVFAFAPPRREPELLAESMIASMWRWPFRPLQHFQDQLKLQYGVDLRQSWAFAYIRRALLPVASVLLVLAWILTGLHEVPVDGRAVYERFGKPIAVWKPGFHLGLPWPCGRVLQIEYGVVHELTAAGIASEAASAEAVAVGAEDFAPDSANRLWDASHVAENSQVIASEKHSGEGREQSFHIVNMDVRFMYRIGMADIDALNATYNSTDIPELIRSSARRILVSYFASRTLEGVLGERRTAIARDIGEQLQADLHGLASGVEIMTTVVEAIHPPAGAANAYHSVQAAQINAQSIIARERGNAAQQTHLAQLRASLKRDTAEAAARETIAGAEAASRRFAAEQEAYIRGGRAFILERYLSQLGQGLTKAELTIIDHRLPAANAVLDLRTFVTPVSTFDGRRADL